MKTILPFLLVTLFFTSTFAQFVPFTPKTNLSSLATETRGFVETLNNKVVLDANTVSISNIKAQTAPFELQVPTSYGTITLELEPFKITSDDFEVRTPTGVVAVELPSFFKGKVKGFGKSVTALAVSDNGIEGLISSEKFDLTIGALEGDANLTHIVYASSEIPNTNPICSGDAIAPFDSSSLGNELPPHATQAATCRAVEVYLEADYEMFTDWGSNYTTVTNNITTIFNNVAMLYDMHGVNVVISELFIWDSVDPYASANNTAESLTLLTTEWNNKGNSFDGNVAHLMSTRLSGGRANLSGGTSVFNGMTSRAVFQSCTKNAAYGVNHGIQTFLATVPTYSSNVNLVAHELGHNFGLPHTHNCNWSDGTNVGALDDCYATEGGCAQGPTPSSGGTIMSYCHVSSTGVNFANGFGTLPGAKMLAEFNAATCLQGSKIARPKVTFTDLCSPGSTIITASDCSGTYTWYDQEAGGSVIGSSATYTTPSISSSTKYYVSCTDNGCESRRREAYVKVFNNQSPIMSDVSACGNNPSITLNANCSGLEVQWFSDILQTSPVATGDTYTLSGFNDDFTVYAACRLESCGLQGAKMPLNVDYTYMCDYCDTPTPSCFSNVQITNVIIKLAAVEVINNTSNCSNSGATSLTVYNSSNPISILAGSMYDFEITIQQGTTPNFQGDRNLTLWIDSDQDGVYSLSEKVHEYESGGTPWTQHNFQVQIPSSTLAGLSRIRLKLGFPGNSGDQPCNVYNSQYNYWPASEIEDYVIDITNLCPSSLTLSSSSDDYNTGTTIREVSNTTGTLTATNKVTGTANVTYKAGKNIQLQPGFKAETGTVFLAEMGGCTE